MRITNFVKSVHKVVAAELDGFNIVPESLPLDVDGQP